MWSHVSCINTPNKTTVGVTPAISLQNNQTVKVVFDPSEFEMPVPEGYFPFVNDAAVFPRVTPRRVVCSFLALFLLLFDLMFHETL